jgi:putative oxidoreductase
VGNSRKGIIYAANTVMQYIVLIGRVLYSAIFLMTVASHFSDSAVAYAASKGAIYPHLMVPLSGVMAIVGALSIILGFKAKWGAWLLVIFLVPVTLVMHAFWDETDPMQIQQQTISFMKNCSMLGAALLIAYFGAGPLSIDAKIKS